MSESRSQFEIRIGQAKESVSLVKELTFILILILLVCFPASFNQRLYETGIKKISGPGYDIQIDIEKSSEKSKEAATNVSQIEERLKQFSALLRNLENKVTDAVVKKEVNNLQSEVESTQRDARSANAAIRQNIVTQSFISESINPSGQNAEGWVYLGKMKAGKGEWFNPAEPATIDAVPLPLKAGQIVSIRDAAYIRENTPPRSSAKVLGVFRVGEKGEISELDYIQSPEKDFYVWAKLKKYTEIN